MNKFLIFSFLLLISILNATIISVDNKFPSIGDYTNLQDAHDNAVAGDTIYVYPSQVQYDGIHVYKQLAIIGPGFGYSYEEDGIHIVTIGEIWFDSGSENSIIQGFEIVGINVNVDNISIHNNYISNQITINGNNTLIKRNLIASNNTSVHGISVSSNHNNNQIIGNKIKAGQACIFIEESNSISIENNLIINTYVNYGIYGEYNSNTIIMINNVIHTANGTSWAIRVDGDCYAFNNIFINGYVNGAIFEYNMSNHVMPEGNTNLTSIDMSSVFVDYPNEDYNLIPGSPAIDTGHPGAGYNDLDGSRNDMGIYGGQTPYINIYNKPTIPTIFEIQADEVTSPENGLDIEINATTGQ